MCFVEKLRMIPSACPETIEACKDIDRWVRIWRQEPQFQVTKCPVSVVLVVAAVGGGDESCNL